jgi:LDH2 family malate/lactate/ureidoglycolate dehydrogenase
MAGPQNSLQLNKDDEGFSMRVSGEQVRKQILSVFAAWGMDPQLAETTADVMVDTDLAGIDSHGLSMLMFYEGIRDRGELVLDAAPVVAREHGATALLDARGGLGHPAAVMGMELAVEKAAAFGVGVVTVFNSHHFGAAGYYASIAARHGMIGMVTTSARTMAVLPARGAVPMLPTNPIAFAAPARRNRPFLLDMSTSTVAANKVKVYEFHGKPLPAGWVLDAAGQPVVDAAEAMKYIFEREDGGVSPLGGTLQMGSHKGYGLSVMVQILSATLSGGVFAPVREQRPGDPDNIGHFFLAIDPKAFRAPGEFEDDLDVTIDLLHATTPVDPALPVLVPGDPEATMREERVREGIPVPQALKDKIRGVCERSGAEYLLD